MSPRTSTPILAKAMRRLAAEIDSPDGVANAAILEAALRLEEHAHAEAEQTDLRRVATDLLGEHARLASPYACLCGLCRIAGRWVKAPAPTPHPPITPRCPLLARAAQEEACHG